MKNQKKKVFNFLRKRNMYLLNFIPCNFLVRTLQCFLFFSFNPEILWINQPQKLLIIGPIFFFFSNANQPKSSPNLISCSMKMSHHGTSLQWLWVWAMYAQSGSHQAYLFLNLSLQNNLNTQTRYFENGIKVVGKSFQIYVSFKDHQTLPPIQSHYREVPRWGVSNRARHNWKCFLAYFFFQLFKKKK